MTATTNLVFRPVLTNLVFRPQDDPIPIEFKSTKLALSSVITGPQGEPGPMGPTGLDYYINVKNEEYGALGDGITDDSVAIQTALDACLGKALFFPAGTYICSGLVLPQTTSVQTIALHGAGNGVSVLKLKDSANTYLLASWSYVNNSSVASQGPVIEGLEFDGNKANQSVDSPLVIIRGGRSIIDRILIRNSSLHGLLFSSNSENGTPLGSGMGGNLFTSSRILNCKGAGIYAHDTDQQFSDATIVDSKINNNGDVSNGYYNIDFERGSGCGIINCNIFGSPNGDIRMINCGGAMLAHNNIDGTFNVATGVPIKTVILTSGGYGTICITGNTFRNSAASLGAATEARLLDLTEEKNTGMSVTGNTFHSTEIPVTSIAYASAIGTKLRLAGNVFSLLSPASNGALFEYDSNYVQGLKGDATDIIKTVSIAFESNVLTITESNPFDEDDIGKVIIVPGAGTAGAWKGSPDSGLDSMVTAADLVTTITAVGETTITLAANAGSTVTSASLQLFYASDDYPALANAMVGNHGVFVLDPTKRFFFYSGAPYLSKFSRLTSLSYGFGYATGADNYRFRETKPCLILNPAYPIIMETATGLDGFCILRMGYRTPRESAAGMRRCVERYAGTAVQVGAQTGTHYQTVVRGPYIGSCLVVGFNKLIDFLAINTARPVVEKVNGDGINGFDLKNCGDVSRILNYHLWPFGTANGMGGNPKSWFITSAVDDGLGGIRVTIGAQTGGPIDQDIICIKAATGLDKANIIWRWKLSVVDQATGVFDLEPWEIGAKVPVFGTFDITLAEMVMEDGWRSGFAMRLINSDGGKTIGGFSKGYDVAVLCSATNHQFVGVSMEGPPDSKDPTTRGYVFEDDPDNPANVITGGKIDGGSILSMGTAISYKCAGNNLNKLVVVGTTIGYGSYRTAELLNGKMEIVAPDYKRITGGVNKFYVATLASMLAFVGGDPSPPDYVLETEAPSDADKVVFSADTGDLPAVATAAASLDRVADTVLADPELAIGGLLEDGVYSIDGEVWWTQGVLDAGGIRMSLNVSPTGSGLEFDWWHTTGNNVETHSTGAVVNGEAIDATGTRVFSISGILRCGNASRDLTLNWGQLTTNATVTTRKRGSFIRATKIL